MIFYYIEEPNQDEFGWTNERKRGIRKKVNDLKGVLSVVSLDAINSIPPRSTVIVNSYSVEWTEKCISALLGVNLKPIQMIESQNTSFVSYDYEKEYNACLDVLDQLAAGKPIAFFGKDTKSIRDNLKIKLFIQRYGEKAQLFDSPFSCEPIEIKKFGAVFASNDIIGLGLLEYVESHKINLPIGCPISTSIGTRNKNKFIHFTIDNYILGQQAVTLATILQKNPNVSNINMYIEVEDSLSSLSPLSLSVCDGKDYLINDDVKKMYIVNKILGKSDEKDVILMRALSNNKSIGKISEELFMGETTIKYRLMKLFGTIKLKQCRTTSKLVIDWLKKSE